MKEVLKFDKKGNDYVFKIEQNEEFFAIIRHVRNPKDEDDNI